MNLHKSSFHQIIKFSISVRLAIPLEFNLEFAHVSLGSQQCREIVQGSYRLIVFLHAAAEQFVKQQKLIIDTYCRCQICHRLSLETSSETGVSSRFQFITKSLRINGVDFLISPDTRILLLLLLFFLFLLLFFFLFLLYILFTLDRKSVV